MSTDIWFEKEIKELLCVVAGAKSVQDVENLFEKILTPREINDMARRFKILLMLEDGCSYSEIQNTLRVSSSIISRLSYHVGYGFRRSMGKSKRDQAIESVAGALKKYAKSKKISYKGSPGIIPIARR